MSKSPDMAIEFLTIITGFLSDNSTTIAVVLLLFIFREAISNLISRITSFLYEKGDTKVGLEAANRPEIEKKTTPLDEAIEKPDSDNEAENIQHKAREQDWFSEMHSSFIEGRFDNADAIFKKYSLDEKDQLKLEENRAFYLYFKFEKAKDNSAIEELEKLVKTASTEETKFIALSWLSFCLSDSNQHKKNIEVWRTVKSETKSSSYLTNAIVSLAYALNKNSQYAEAKKELLNRLKKAEGNKQLSSIYEALAKIESSLGNKKISIYCKDKSLEYDPNNRDELFNSAYAASTEDIDEISISNYTTLINIDNENSTALNNLGVKAQESELKIIAIDNYKKSTGYKNTLAMANQGYLLLGAGFVSEAEKIAQNAIEEDDTHQNIYSLLTAIHKQKEEQENKWKELGSKALFRQKSARVYIEQYYLGRGESLKGDWVLRDKHQIHIEVDGNSLTADWIENQHASSVAIKLNGEIMGSTFAGTYNRKRTDGAQTGLLGISGDVSISCIGFLSPEEETLNIVATKLKDDLSLSLSKPKA